MCGSGFEPVPRVPRVPRVRRAGADRSNQRGGRRRQVIPGSPFRDEMNLYIVLGVQHGASERDQTRLPTSCAAVSSGHQCGTTRRSALPADPGCLRNARRSDTAFPLDSGITPSRARVAAANSRVSTFRAPAPILGHVRRSDGGDLSERGAQPAQPERADPPGAGAVVRRGVRRYRRTVNVSSRETCRACNESG